MAFIDNQLLQFKQLIEDSIITGGAKGKESIIRSSGLIYQFKSKYDNQQHSSGQTRHHRSES